MVATAETEATAFAPPEKRVVRAIGQASKGRKQRQERQPKERERRAAGRSKRGELVCRRKGRVREENRGKKEELKRAGEEGNSCTGERV